MDSTIAYGFAVSRVDFTEPLCLFLTGLGCYKYE